MTMTDELIRLLLEYGTTGLRVLCIIGIGLPLLMVASRTIGKLIQSRYDLQSAMIGRKAVFYTGILVLTVTVMHNMGFQLGALLGTAGVMGLAVGFASQTSLSNLISGIFLVTEKAFELGDVITVGGTTGVVHSIDMLSVKLRTFDNRFVRIPNETMIKTEVTNITRFPIRRFDINLGVAYKEDIARVLDILADIADTNHYVLDEPAPIILFTGFGDSALTILFGVWFAKADFLDMRRSIMRQIKERFDAEGIEIPFPHRTLYTGDVTKPFPITLVNADPAASVVNTGES